MAGPAVGTVLSHGHVEIALRPDKMLERADGGNCEEPYKRRHDLNRRHDPVLVFDGHYGSRDHL